MRPTGRRAAPRRGAKAKKAVRRAARAARAAGKKIKRSTVKPRRTRAANSRRARAAKAKSRPKSAVTKGAVAKRATPRASSAARKRTRSGAVVQLVAPRAATPGARRKKLARAKKAEPPFRASQGAGAKQRLIFELVRARVAVQGAIQGLQPPTVEQRPGSGVWTVRDHALHLCHWDAEVGRALESALHGIAPSWADFDGDDTDQFNGKGVEDLRHLSWDEVRRLLMSSRMELMEALESMPAEPEEPWMSPHPLHAMLEDLAWNDRHHADIIKRWRLDNGV